MAHENYWHRRLAEVTLKASVTGNQRLRAVYHDLAAHYVSMAELCRAGAATRPNEAGLSINDSARAQTGGR